eukprot:COSAG02_NODE_1687_length_11318_cov_2.699349_2_plen_57_part_00
MRACDASVRARAAATMRRVRSIPRLESTCVAAARVPRPEPPTHPLVVLYAVRDVPR